MKCLQKYIKKANARSWEQLNSLLFVKWDYDMKTTSNIPKRTTVFVEKGFSMAKFENLETNLALD